MVRRILAPILIAAVVASGCSASESPPTPGTTRTTEAPDPSASTPAAPPTLELGAWHALVDGPDGLVLVNGHPEDETDPGPLELWRPSEEGWRLVPVMGERPSGRNFAGVALDRDARHLVLHGGLTAEGASAETWRWDGSRWTLAADGDAGPGPRSSPSMALDAPTGTILLYGGDDGTDQYGDTWALDGTRWTQVATDGPEPVRWPAAMASDPEGGGVVLYGGHQVEDPDAGIAVADTWVWRGARWRRVAGAGTPGPLVNAGMVVDPDLGLLLLGGGDDRGRERGRLWQWNGSGWTPMPSGLLPKRQAFGLAYDADRDVVVLTGGLVEPGSTDRLQDTWLWSGDLGLAAERSGRGP